MRYFECTKCQSSFVYGGPEIPHTCGAFIGMTVVKGEMVAAGCGGNMKEITKKQADVKVEQLRS